MNSTSAMLSEKFFKEANRFYGFANEAGIILESKSNKKEIVSWGEFDFEFVEPGRNKLVAYLKKVMEIYTMKSGNEALEECQIKEIVKEFKDWKPSKKTQSKPQKSTKQTQGKPIDSSKNENVSLYNIEVNHNLDTSDTEFIDVIEQSTEELERCLGKPCKTGQDKDPWNFEWKIQIEDKVYSVYDWLNEEQVFDDYFDSEWFISGEDSSKICQQHVEFLKDMLSQGFQIKSQKQQPQEQVCENENDNDAENDNDNDAENDKVCENNNDNDEENDNDDESIYNKSTQSLDDIDLDDIEDIEDIDDLEDIE